MTTLIIWSSDLEPYEEIVREMIPAYEEDNLHCPKCGKQATYEEGQIDQDITGNDIHGYWYTCHDCRIGTQLWALD